MSPQVKEEMNLITSELWNQYTDIIKKNRPDLDVNSLLFASDELIALEESTPDDKNIYQEAGAVDGIMNRNAFFKNIAKAYNIDYRYNHLKHVINGCTTGKTHCGTEAAHLLMNDVLQKSLIWNTSFNTFRNELICSVVRLEVSVGTAL